MRRFLQSLELFEDNERKNLQFLLPSPSLRSYLGFHQKPFFSLFSKTTLFPRELWFHSLHIFSKEYLVDNTLDDLIALLKWGNIEDNLLDLFPIQKRTTEAFAKHFSKEGLGALVEYKTEMCCLVSQSPLQRLDPSKYFSPMSTMQVNMALLAFL